MADGCGADDERLIRDGLVDGCESLSAREHRRGADGRTSLFEGRRVGIHHSEMVETKIAHGPGSRADIERVTGRNQNDTQAIRLSLGQHGRQRFYFVKRPAQTFRAKPTALARGTT